MTLTLSLVLGAIFNPPVLEFAQLIVPYPGFCSPAHFRRQLKLQTGLTPREIRKSNGF